MPSTKIINVLKGDTFEEILPLFQNTPAEEVIFVLPKKSKLFSKESHFQTLSAQAKELGKTISLLSAPADVSALAATYGFTVMSGRSAAKPATEPVATKAIAQDKDFYDDSTDAFTEDVIVPSDERIPKEPEEDEDDGTHIEEEDEDGNIIIKKKKATTDDDEEDELEADADNLDDKDIDDLDDKDLEDELDIVPEADEEDEKEEASLSANELSEEPAYEIQTAAKMNLPDRTGRSLDGLVNHASRSQKSISISKQSDKPTRLDIKRVQSDEDIENVWRQNAHESVWAEGKPHSGSFWGRLFSSSKKSQVTPGGNFRKATGKGRTRRYVALSLVALLALGAVAYHVEGTANITITPAQKPVQADIKSQASDTYTTVDPTFKKIPGQLFSIQRTVTQDFDATGQKEVIQKARGKVIVSNELTTPQTLISTTRFSSEAGLVFRTLQTITVPAAANAKPGTIAVDIIADKPGPDYNIAAGKFMVMAFKEKGDTDRYNKIYGTSTEATTGGISGMAKVVTEADIAAAKDAVTAKLKDTIKSALGDQTAGLKILNADSQVNVSSITSTIQADQAADKFTVTGVGSLKTIGVKESDIFSLITQYIDKNNSLTVLPEKLSITYRDVAFDDAKSVLNFTISITGPGFAKIDTLKIATDLVGTTEAKLREYLKNTVGIASAKVVLSPFWLKKIPQHSDKIHVQIAY